MNAETHGLMKYLPESIDQNVVIDPNPCVSAFIRGSLPLCVGTLDDALSFSRINATPMANLYQRPYFPYAIA